MELMKKEQKWKYLVNALPDIGNDDQLKILREWFLGKDDQQSIRICAEKAYGDLCRTLRGMGKMEEDLKEAYRDAVYSRITKSITELLEKDIINEDEFDKWHKETCDKIIKISKKDISQYLEKDFYYGHAQKWLNMTLKNMLVAKSEGIFKKLDSNRSVLHVPIDQYVLRAAYVQLGIREIESEKGEVKLTIYGVPKQNSEDLPWSSWDDYNVYIKFQEKVREMISQRQDYNCPIDWEFDAWMDGISQNN